MAMIDEKPDGAADAKKPLRIGETAFSVNRSKNRAFSRSF
jgi:hypothetical protein